ncbi:MAG: hypothetical protein MUE44_32250 [Oscillatoriaceae cyanobacterium Prado104]|jgi:hypothetical protein|nr:hypothetical protein [Oscillatoriaceae cyanobacterium Prado104]
MPRFSYNQQGPNTCGAAVTMVSLQELSVAVPQCTTNLGTPVCELSIWNTIKDLQVGTGADDYQCTPLSLVEFMHDRGLSVTIVHDATRVEKVLEAWSKSYPELRGFYKDKFTVPLANVSSTIANLQSGINVPGDFNNDARVILLCLIQGGDPPSPLHYLLARRDGTDYYIMNPDGGKDTPLNRVALQTFLAENVSLGISIDSPTNYIYTGIALRVRK